MNFTYCYTDIVTTALTVEEIYEIDRLHIPEGLEIEAFHPPKREKRISVWRDTHIQPI